MGSKTWFALEVMIVVSALILLIIRRATAINFNISYDSWCAIVLAFGLGMLIRDVAGDQ